MAYCIVRLAKGLREPVSPYRSCYIFGHDPFSAIPDWWWNEVEPWDQTYTFDLSTISIDHEVVTGDIHFHEMASGTTYFSVKWYRWRDDALVFFGGTVEYDITGDGFSHIGWIGWLDDITHPVPPNSIEIRENGFYYVTIELTGANTWSGTVDFQIIGIPGVGQPGHIWVTGNDNYLYYTDLEGAKRRILGSSSSFCTSNGFMWVHDYYTTLLYFVSHLYTRFIEGTPTGFAGTSGYVWIEATALHYIDGAGNERYVTGDLV